MVLPGFMAVVGLTKSKRPSAFSAIKIIPCEVIPLMSRGSRLTSIDTCLPMISSGEKNSAIPDTTVR
ncbi:hypothetical protein D3C85_1811750 [compost metagenome]